MVRLHWRHFDDEDWVVFESASGATHQLTALSAFVAHALEAGPTSADRLAVEAAAAIGSTDPQRVHAAVLDVLQQFAKLGIATETA